MTRPALLAFASVLAAGGAALLAQDAIPFGIGQGQQAQASAFSPWTMTGAVVAWDAGVEAKAAGYVQVGGVDFVPADDDYFARTSGAIPGVSGGELQFPVTAVLWVNVDSGAGQGFYLLFNDGTTENEFGVTYSGASAWICTERSGGTTAQAVAGSAVTARWQVVIAVWTDHSSRSIYLDTNTTGGTETTTKAASGISSIYAGRRPGGSTEANGEIGPIWILSGDLSGAGNSDERDLIFAGCDPAAVTGFTTLAYYSNETADGTDDSGNGFDLTPSGSPTATTKCLAIRNRISATSPYVARATTSPPTYDATLYSNRGGAAFSSASSQFLVCESTPVTAAPFQVYAVARPTNTGANGVAFSLTNSGAANHSWLANFAGTESGDPFKWGATDGGGAIYAGTSTGYSANTVHLVWGLEASSTSRKAEIDGGSQGTATTSRSPSGVNRIALGIHADATPDTPYGGALGFVLLLDTADTSQQADMEAWTTTEFGVP